MESIFLRGCHSHEKTVSCQRLLFPSPSENITDNTRRETIERKAETLWSLWQDALLSNAELFIGKNSEILDQKKKNDYFPQYLDTHIGLTCKQTQKETDGKVQDIFNEDSATSKATEKKENDSAVSQQLVERPSLGFSDGSIQANNTSSTACLQTLPKFGSHIHQATIFTCHACTSNATCEVPTQQQPSNTKLALIVQRILNRQITYDLGNANFSPPVSNISALDVHHSQTENPSKIIPLQSSLESVSGINRKECYESENICLQNFEIIPKHGILSEKSSIKRSSQESGQRQRRPKIVRFIFCRKSETYCSQLVKMYDLVTTYNINVIMGKKKPRGIFHYTTTCNK